ncbi:MAG: hypothetical protein JWP61_1938 [Friedmanniella sp.]|nr:hypothetical protein [Friedmanniella sp.]
MSQIAYADPQAPAPALGLPTGEVATGSSLSARIRLAASVPLAVSLGAHLLFFITYWMPETRSIPAHDWWLTQLCVLVSPTLSSSGVAQVPAQAAGWGLPGALLLVCSVALFWMSRRPHWLGHVAMVLPAVVGLVTALVTVGTLLGQGQLRASAVGALLMGVWVFAALYAVLLAFGGDPGPPPTRTWRNGFVLLVAYAVVGVAPTAVGRSLFAPGLRDAAIEVAHNTVALRLSALWTGTTVLVYLCGLGVGVTVWLAFQCWPPRRELSYVGLCLVLIAVMVATASLGWPTSTAAARRATQLHYVSPTNEVGLSCGAWRLPDPGGAGLRPTRTIVITGFSCQRATTFSGYRQVSTRVLTGPLSPVTAVAPDGTHLGGRMIAAQYGSVVVVAASDRIDTAATELIALRVIDGAEVWRFRCNDGKPMALRFAGVPDGEDRKLGHITRGETGPAVVTVCSDRTTLFNPALGPPS